MSPSKPVTVPSNNIARFTALAEDIARRGNAAGVTIKAYNDPRLPVFSSLSASKQANTLKVLTHQRDFFAMADETGLPLDSVQIIWRTLNKMGLTPTSDIFDRIEKEDTVEVYEPDGIPSFKNLVFFRFISMTIEEIFSLPWYQQMTASPQLVAYFLEMATRLKLVGFKQTFAPRFNDYSFYEKRGEKRHIHINLKWISPVMGADGTQALLFVNRSRLLK